jgi:hypothetical protein
MIRRLLPEERGMALGLAIIELAEAGIEVAKAHLANDSSPADWSSGELNMTSTGDGSVAVTVEYDAESQSFKAISTGNYRETSRKIEAIFSIEDGKPKLLSWRELYE